MTELEEKDALPAKEREGLLRDPHGIGSDRTRIFRGPHQVVQGEIGDYALNGTAAGIGNRLSAPGAQEVLEDQSISTTPWRTAKTSAWSRECTSSLARILLM